MKKLIPTLCLSFVAALLSCHEQSVPLTDGVSNKILSEIPSSWIMLTDYDGQLVIFHPCDANNATVDIRNDTLHVNWGLEEGFYHITSIAKPSGQKIRLTAETDSGETEEIFSATFLDTEKKLSRWYVWLDDTTSAIFTDSRYKGQYKEVKQPCTECWGYDVCNETEKDSVSSQQLSSELIASDF